MKPETATYLILQEIRRRTEQQQLAGFYPETGDLSRHRYIKHLKMFAAGLIHNERAALGGNRVGKTVGIGGYETALHLTGLYPDWWEGKVFTKPILAWAGGTKSTKTRDVNQKILLGRLEKKAAFTQATGGMIPSARIGRLTRKSGVADAIDQVVIRHVKGHENLLTFKGYEEGRHSFESEAVDWIWLDEEPPKGIYDECLMRLITTKGSILSTFTPVEGMTETVLSLLKDSDLMSNKKRVENDTTTEEA